MSTSDDSPPDGSDARAAVLGSIRGALARSERRDPAAARQRLADPPGHSRPAPARDAAGTLIETFTARAEAAGATVETVAGMGDVPARAAAFLEGAELPAALRLAGEPAITGLDWAGAGLAVAPGPAAAGDRAALTRAVAGLAETGGVVLASSGERPASLAFLPEACLIVLAAEAIVASYEDAWAKLARDGTLTGPAGSRAMHLITGPSRSADIEQTLQLGAHGPKQVHMLLIAETG